MGQVGLGAEFLLAFKRPVRFSEQLPGEGHQVGVPSGHNLVRMLRLGDQPDGPRHHPRLVPYSSGKRYLICPADWDAGFRDEPAGGNVDQVDS